jgi:hypothetical protein
MLDQFSWCPTSGAGAVSLLMLTARRILSRGTIVAAGTDARRPSGNGG